jgi:hypothetical protein
MLEWQGQYIIPGGHWLRIDPKDWNPEDLGTGLRVDGDLVERDIAYGQSAHFGLCGISSLDGAFYKFSFDASHPLSVRATAEIPKGPSAIEEKGHFEFSENHSRFWAGQGVIGSEAGQLFSMDYVDVFPHEYPAAVSYVSRLIGSEDERRRIGLNADQLNSLKSGAAYVKVELDQAKVRPLFQAFENAKGADARNAAAQPLYAEARNFGARKAKVRNDYIARVQSALTPLQWKLVSYQHLTPAETTEARSLREQATSAAIAAEASAAVPVEPSHELPPSVIVGGAGLVAIGVALGIQAWRRNRAQKQ